MSTKTWTIHVAGVSYEVTAVTDPENGRTFVRVDGRMAARPMSAADEERDVDLGSARYILRRLPSGDFDLDPAPPDFSAGAPAWTPPTRKTLATPIQRPSAGGKGVFRIVAGIIVTIVLVLGWRYAKDAISYLRVPWQTYTAPDSSFRIAVAGKPEQESNYINGYAAVQLRSRYKDHIYLLEWINLPFVLPYEKEGEVLNSMLEGFVQGENAKLIERDWSHATGRDALHFIAQLPGSKEWSRGTLRGQLIPDGKRIYIVYAFVPQGESLAFDVGEYLRSIELPR